MMAETKLANEVGSDKALIFISPLTHLCPNYCSVHFQKYIFYFLLL